MTRTEMIETYNRLTAATGYILGFIAHGSLYYIRVKHIADSFLKLDRMSSKRGGWAKIRIRLSANDREALIANGSAIKLGGAELLETADRYNKGERFERVITETLTSTAWVKDSVPFNVAGDITLDGEEIQVKLDGAELTNEKMLGRLVAA